MDPVPGLTEQVEVPPKDQPAPPLDGHTAAELAALQSVVDQLPEGAKPPPWAVADLRAQIQAEAAHLGHVAESPPNADLEPFKGPVGVAGTVPDSRLTPGTQVPPAPARLPKGTIIATEVDTKFIDEFIRINASRDACDAIVRSTVATVEDRYQLLAREQAALWDRLLKQYRLDPTYVYKLDHDSRQLIVVGRIDDEQFLTPGLFHNR